jgi:hypothetical protein
MKQKGRKAKRPHDSLQIPLLDISTSQLQNYKSTEPQSARSWQNETTRPWSNERRASAPVFSPSTKVQTTPDRRKARRATTSLLYVRQSSASRWDELRAKADGIFAQKMSSRIVIDSYTALGAPTPHHRRPKFLQLFSPSKDHQRAAEEGATLIETFFAVVKSFFGATVLYLPFSISRAGTVASFFIMLMSASLCIYACLRLIRITEHHPHLATYGQIAETAMGPRARTYIQVSLVLVQSGFALTYYVFVARNIHVIITTYHPDAAITVPVLILLLAFLQIPFSQMRSLQRLSYTNTLSCILIGICCTYMLVFSFHKLATQGAKPLPICELDHAPMMVGISVFAFEGIGLLLPLRQSLRPKDRHMYPMLITYTLGGESIVQARETHVRSASKQARNACGLGKPT